jgi:glycerol transport system ATP-binding protein
VSVTEITGSESFVHLDFADVRWVMLAHGVYSFEAYQEIEVFLDTRHIMVFDAEGRSAAQRGKLAA